MVPPDPLTTLRRRLDRYEAELASLSARAECLRRQLELLGEAEQQPPRPFETWAAYVTYMTGPHL